MFVFSFDGVLRICVVDLSGAHFLSYGFLGLELLTEFVLDMILFTLC